MLMHSIYNPEATTQCTLHKLFILLLVLVLISSVSVHFSVSTLDTWHRITQNQCLLMVQHSLSSMFSAPEICPYDSSFHLKEALMQRRYVRHTLVKQEMPTGPEQSVQVCRTLNVYHAKTWMVILTHQIYWSLVQVGINGISSGK